MWPSPCKSTNKHTPDYSIHWQAVKKNKNTKPKETLKPKQLLNKHKEPQKINAQDSWKLIHNFSPRRIFPLPLKGFGHAETLSCSFYYWVSHLLIFFELMMQVPLFLLQMIPEIAVQFACGHTVSTDLSRISDKL